MNKLKKGVFAVIPMIAMYASSLTASAASTGNAVVDIMRDGRFNGAMSQIQWLTKMVDNWFIQIITITAFFIISMSLLKNALAAAYCAFPTFFNKVHDAHNNNQGFKLAEIKQFGSNLANRPIGDIILSMIPDIKAMTDFEGTEMSPKEYFMRAVPQMCIMVILGIFIYNGYYRDVSATVGQAGASILENMLSSVDPESAVNKFFNTTSKPKNIFDNDPSIEGQMAKDISEKLYTSIIARSNYITDSQAQKDGLMRDCELAALNLVRGDDGYNFWSDSIADLNSQYADAQTKLDEENPTTSDEESEVDKTQAFGSTIFQCPDPNYHYQLTGLVVNLVHETSKPDVNNVSYTENGALAFNCSYPVVQIAHSLESEMQGELADEYVVISGNLTPVVNTGAIQFASNVNATASSYSSSRNVGFSVIYIGTDGWDSLNPTAQNGYYNLHVTDITSYIKNTILPQYLEEGFAFTGEPVYSGTAAGTATGGYYHPTSKSGEIGSVDLNFRSIDSGAVISIRMSIIASESKTTAELYGGSE